MYDSPAGSTTTAADLAMKVLVRRVSLTPGTHEDPPLKGTGLRKSQVKQPRDRPHVAAWWYTHSTCGRSLHQQGEFS